MLGRSTELNAFDMSNLRTQYSLYVSRASRMAYTVSVWPLGLPTASWKGSKNWRSLPLAPGAVIAARAYARRRQHVMPMGLASV